MSSTEEKIAQMLASLLEEITLATGKVLSSKVAIKGTIENGYYINWEGIVYIGYAEDEVIDPSEIDLGINQICHEILEGQIAWNNAQNFLELNDLFTENLFEQNWQYEMIGITDDRMNLETVKNVLDIIGTESIGAALLEFYESEQSVPFQKYPDFLANLLRDCVQEAASSVGL